MAQGLPGLRKGAKMDAGRRPEAPQNGKKIESVFPNRFWTPPGDSGLRFGMHFRIILDAKIVNCSCYVLASFFDGFWMAPGHFGRLLELFFATFYDFGKNGEPFESIINGSQIEVGRLENQQKSVPKLMEKL